MSAKQMGVLPEKDQGRQVKLKMHQPSPVRGRSVVGAGASQVLQAVYQASIPRQDDTVNTCAVSIPGNSNANLLLSFVQGYTEQG